MASQDSVLGRDISFSAATQSESQTENQNHVPEENQQEITLTSLIDRPTDSHAGHANNDTPRQCYSESQFKPETKEKPTQNDSEDVTFRVRGASSVSVGCQKSHSHTRDPVTEHYDSVTKSLEANTEFSGVVQLQSTSGFELESTSHDPWSLPYDCRTLSGHSCTSSENNDIIEEADESFAFEIVSLNTIPVEILLYICHYLEAEVIINILAKVCKAFNSLFNNEAYWKIRLMKQWPKKYPAVDYDIKWKKACVQRERCHKIWSRPDQYLDHFIYEDGMLASVDVVHVMQAGRLLAAGSRDRYLTLLDLSKYNAADPSTVKECKLHGINRAHNGWIWSMGSLDNFLYTGSWDAKIKVWDLEQQCQSVASYKCKSAVLCLHVEQNFVTCGCFDKKVYFIDTRQGGTISTKLWHRQPVLCIAADDNYIISGSEDKTFSVYDRRAGRMYKSIQVEEYALDVSYQNNQLWFGNKVGKLSLIDGAMGRFEVVEVYDVGHTDKVTGVIHTEGAIFTSSNDKSIKVLEPSRQPATLTSLDKHSGVAGISYQNGVLVSGGCDSTIGVWKPKCDQAS